MEGSVLIRPMTGEDYDEVHALWLTIKGFGIRAVDDSREDIERFIRRNPRTSVVAVIDGKIVGSILCGRLGIGRQMVGTCMRSLREEGISKVSLVAFTTNKEGNAFWKDIGWKKREDFFYYDFLLNEKNITRFIGD